MPKYWVGYIGVGFSYSPSVYSEEKGYYVPRLLEAETDGEAVTIAKKQYFDDAVGYEPTIPTTITLRKLPTDETLVFEPDNYILASFDTEMIHRLG